MKKTILVGAALAAALTFSVPVSAETTLEKIKHSGTIKLGYRENSIPFSFVGDDKQPHGYSVDLCRIVADDIARELGLAKLDVRWVLVTAKSRFNALKHGILSRYTVLSHENHADYESLVNALMDEHLPAGATEQHLIEELASVIWRKRRVLQSEGATINKGLKETARNAKSIVLAAVPFVTGLSGEYTDLRDVMSLTDEEAVTDQRNASADVQACYRATKLLRTGGATAYAKAVRALHPESRAMWEDSVADGENTPTAEGLAAFIQQHLEPVARELEKEARHHEAIKNQAMGEGLQAWKLEKLSRYETHLDRKFERTLGMLVKLKELRTQRTG